MESSRQSLYTDSIVTQPHSKLKLKSLAAPHPIPQLPAPNTHPVILARRMLMFAITLQSPCEEKEMHGTVESLICIILEAVFEVNCGNLRRAWLVYRRAMAVALLMGLHRSPMPPLKRIDPELGADPEFMWFRVVYMDRYLSLLLGLPQGTTDKSMGAISVLEHEPPLGKFERQLTVIASCILQRNESVIGDDADGQGGTEKNGDDLSLRIPYLGVIKIARQDPISCELSGAHQMSPVESPQREPALAVSNDGVASFPHAPSTEGQQPLDHLHSTTQGYPFRESFRHRNG